MLKMAWTVHSFVGKMLYLNLFGMVLVSLLEGIGIFLLIPMLNSSGIVNIGTGSISISISTVLESFSFHLNLLVILTIYVFLIVAQAMLQRSETIQNTNRLYQLSKVKSIPFFITSKVELFYKKRNQI